jgi:hypothetical protein
MRLTFRNGVEIEDPVRSALAFLENDYSYRSYDSRIVEHNASVSLDDIKVANRIGARMSAAESEALYGRRHTFNSALVRIPADSSLCDPDDAIPWDALHEFTEQQMASSASV